MRLTPLKPSVIIRTLEIVGFIKIRQKGSHIFMRHPDGRTTVIPYHRGEDLGRGMVRKILRDIRMEWEDFRRYT